MPRAWWPPASVLAPLISVALPSASQTVLIPALPVLAAERGYSVLVNGWLLGAFLVGASLASVTVAWLARRWGRRRVTLLVSACYLLGSALCLLAGDQGWVMVLGRGFQGYSAGVFVLHIAAAQTTGPDARACAGQVGALSAAVATGPALGFLVGGGVTAAVGVAGIFVLGLGLGLTSTALLWRSVPRGLPAGLPLGGPRPGSGLTLDRTQVLGNLATLWAAAAMFGLFVAVPALVQDAAAGLALGPVAAGLVLAPGAVAIAVVAPIAARAGAVRGHGRVFALGNLLCLLGLGGLALRGEGVAVVAVVLLATVAGAGVGIAFPAMPIVVTRAAAATGAVEAAAGLNSLARGLGSAGGAQLALVVAAAWPVAGAGHGAAFASSAACAGVACLLGLLVGRGRPLTRR